MGCLDESTIRNYLGGASFASGLICFACGSTYDKLFGKLGVGGVIIYLGISLGIFYLIWGIKRIPVPERFKSVVVEAILFVTICLISVGLDILVPGKSDAWSIISYGLFALMSVSTSRKSELGFETGFFTFFLSLFSQQLVKTNRNLLPIALCFCLAALLLRHRSQSGTPNGDRPQEVVPLINATTPATDNHEYLNVERQYPPRVGQDSGESLSSSSNQENNQEDSYEAAHHSPSNNGEVSEESILEVVRDNQQNNNQEETSSSFPAESSNSSEQDHVSPANYQNGYVHSSQAGPVRRRRMTPAIQNISSSLGDPLRLWHPLRLFFHFSVAVQLAGCMYFLAVRVYNYLPRLLRGSLFCPKLQDSYTDALVTYTLLLFALVSLYTDRLYFEAKNRLQTSSHRV